MEAAETFCLFDCSLVRCATGRVCSNLRELLDADPQRAGSGAWSTT